MQRDVVEAEEERSVSARLQAVQDRIAQAVKQADRAPESVSLVAVSKKQPECRIREALEAGQRIFGENRVQEAKDHWSGLRSIYPDLTLHLIGPLQTNKVKDAVALFDVIETVDREKLALALKAEMDKQNKHCPCYIQVNTGEEPQKAGVLPSNLETFKDFCMTECGLDVQGLMCIPPIDDPPALHFALLAQYAKALNLPCLSMGMSDDFEKAIALGATHIRVGTGVFGPR